MTRKSRPKNPAFNAMWAAARAQIEAVVAAGSTDSLLLMLTPEQRQWLADDWNAKDNPPPSQENAG